MSSPECTKPLEGPCENGAKLSTEGAPRVTSITYSFSELPRAFPPKPDDDATLLPQVVLPEVALRILF